MLTLCYQGEGITNQQINSVRFLYHGINQRLNISFNLCKCLYICKDVQPC